MSSRFCRRDYGYSSEYRCCDFCPQRSFGGRVDNAQISIEIKDFAFVISRIQWEKSRNCDSNRTNKNHSTVPNTQRLPSSSFLLQIRVKSRIQVAVWRPHPRTWLYGIYVAYYNAHFAYELNWLCFKGLLLLKESVTITCKWNLFNWFA